MIKRHPVFWGLLSTSLALSIATSSQAEQPQRPPAGESPTAGVRLPTPTALGQTDATAIETNPAAITFSPGGWSLAFQHTELRGLSRLIGTGDGLFVAAALPFWRKLFVGAAIQWLRPSSTVGYPDTAKLSFALGWRPSAYWSLGAAIHRIYADDAPSLAGLTTLDLGLTVTPRPWLGFGLAVQQVTTPVLDGLPLQRGYNVELALRPTSTPRFELGLGAAIGERRQELDPFVRLALEIVPGVRLLGHSELLRRDLYRDGVTRTDLRTTLALSVSFERMGLSVGAVLGKPLETAAGTLGESAAARSAYQGVSLGAQLHGGIQNTRLAPQQRLVALELRGPLAKHWVELVRWFEQLQHNHTVNALLLKIADLELSWAEAQELRLWLQRIRSHSTGPAKRIYAFLTAPSAREYYAAAAADRVLLDTAGGLHLQGLARQTLYLRGLFDKLGIEPQFIQIAEYKSAPEMFTRQGPSKPAIEVGQALLDNTFQQVLSDLAHDRHSSPTTLRKTFDQGPFTAPAALKAGLVDELVDDQQLTSRVEQLAKARLAQANVVAPLDLRWPGGAKVAVIVLDGDIVQGESKDLPLIDQHLVGDQTIVKALEQAKRNPLVKSVVLRVQSPGGSALASYHIWRAVRSLRQVKPVIVSFGAIAASGGYFAGCAADQIYALPATLTGSIGIFTGKFALGQFLQRLGVNSHTLEHGQRATMDSAFRPYTEQEQAFLLRALSHFYRQFLAAVAEGRKLTLEQAHHVARGRVWSGEQAQQHQLIDTFGGLYEAIRAARQRAGLNDNAGWIVLPHQPKGWLDRALALFGATTANTLPLPLGITQQLRLLPALLWYATTGEALARLPYQPQ